MHMIKNNIVKSFLFSFSLLFGALTMASCGNNVNEGFDNTRYDISALGDKSVMAQIEKLETGYKLELSGNGDTKNFTEKNKAPWYSISAKIKEVKILEGITSLGNEMFNKLKLNYYILPNTLTKIGSNTFTETTNLYSYADEIESASNYNIFYYSESMPSSTDSSSKQYWHLLDNEPIVWVLERIKILFIGNSFTFYSDIPSITQSIGRDLGYDLICESVTKGSHTLEKFADPNDEMGKQVYEKLNTNNDYDYMILQEQSTRSYSNNESFKKGVKTLKQLADSTQEHCQTRLYSTWGFQEEADRLQITIPEMELKIRNAYESLANEINSKVHQVGKAFSKIYEEHKEINLYYDDNKHPSYQGAYLSALIHVGSIFNCDVRLTKFDGTIDDATSKILKDVAYNILYN